MRNRIVSLHRPRESSAQRTTRHVAPPAAPTFYASVDREGLAIPDPFGPLNMRHHNLIRSFSKAQIRDAGDTVGMSRRAAVVLGMHRSGTSAVAGLLVRLGLEAPRTLMPPNDANRRGYWESAPIVECHDRLLRAAGTSWDSWSSVDARWQQSAEAQPWRDELGSLCQSEYGSGAIPVLKDPRMCRLVPLWRATLREAGIDPMPILVVRHPAEVAASLAARDGLSPEFAALLWLRHMIDAERETRDLPRTVVVLDDLLRDGQDALERLSRQVGVSMDREQRATVLAACVDPALLHHKGAASESAWLAPLDEWLHLVMKAFDRLASGLPANSETFAWLDAAGSALDHAAAVFGAGYEAACNGLRAMLGSAAMEQRTWQEQCDVLRAEHARLAQERVASSAELRSVQTWALSLEQDAKVTRAAFDGARAEWQRMESVLQLRHAEQQADNERLQQENEDLRLRTERLQSDADRAHARLDALSRELENVKAELTSTSHRLSALLSSASWRLTSPLRAGLRTIRRGAAWITGRGSVE